MRNWKQLRSGNARKEFQPKKSAEHSFPPKGRWREDAELETASERKRPEGISAEEVGGTFLPAKGRWREDAELE